MPDTLQSSKYLLDNLFDEAPLTKEKVHKIILYLYSLSSPYCIHSIKRLFDELFIFPEFTLEKLQHMLASKVLDETFFAGFLTSAIRNNRDKPMIEYLQKT